MPIKLGEISNCSRCGAVFDPLKVELPTKIEQFLIKTSYKSVCNNCINDLDKMFNLLSQIPFPTRGQPLIAGIHYNIENDLWVFTEFYHFSRGNCCQNSCRNCAYGFIK